MDDIRNRISMDTLIENKYPGYEKESFIREEISFIQILFGKNRFQTLRHQKKEEEQKKPIKECVVVHMWVKGSNDKNLFHTHMFQL